MPLVTVIRNTVMFNMVEIPRVIFSPDSAGIRKTKLDVHTKLRGLNAEHLQGEDVDKNSRLDEIEQEKLRSPPNYKVIPAYKEPICRTMRLEVLLT